MAVKKSRTGKKKRPQYGPQGTKKNEAPVYSEEDLKNYKNARHANYLSIGLLVVAMILLLVGPNVSSGNSMVNLIVIVIAYVLTIISGGLILYTKKYVIPDRVKMTTITGWSMVGVGVFGLIFTFYSAF